MSTISPSLQIGGVNGWKSKEGAVLGWQQTSGGLFKPAKFDFTRLSGSASYVDENGLIQIENRPNYPRFTWQDGKQCLMNEEARTNFVRYSEALDNAAYTKRGTCSITANDTVSPDGETTADLISGLNAQNIDDIFQSLSGLTNNASLGVSFYVKRVSTSGVIKLQNTIGFAQGQWDIDMSLLSDSWERITADHAAVTVNNAFVASGTGTAGWQLYASGGPLSFHCWGVDIQEGSYASSYIPTEGSAVTRAAESIEGLNLGNFLGDSQGGLYVEGQLFSTSALQVIAELNDDSTNNRIALASNASSQYSFAVIDGGVSQAALGSTSVTANTFFKMFGAYAENDFAFYLDGSADGTDSSGTIPSGIDQFNTSRSDGSLLSRGLIHEIRAYDQRPANSQMETETA